VVKPYIKWAGGKAKLLKTIQQYYPDGLGTTITKYAEPFIGGGAVLFDILNNYSMEQVYISDSNVQLINTYRDIRDNLEGVLGGTKELEEEYLKCNMDDRELYYYRKRDRYNEIKGDNLIEVSSLFIFLNRTCYTGLYRVNLKGNFNTSHGKYTSPVICDESNLTRVSERLRGVEIVTGDYKLSEGFIDNKTFCYVDPPYRPLVPSGFTAYTQGKFGDGEQVELARYVGRLTGRGAYVIASNSDPRGVNEGDMFLDDLYSGYRIVRVRVNRAINSDKSKRGKVGEILIVSS
jgi:DNA adenine methylase